MIFLFPVEHPESDSRFVERVEADSLESAYNLLRQRMGTSADAQLCNIGDPTIEREIPFVHLHSHSTYRIYVLIDPRDMRIRYVGITSKPLKNRYNHHIYNANAGKKGHRHAWIRVLLSLSLKPIVQEVEITDDVDREAYWIAQLLAHGHQLTNECKGGYGFGGMKGRHHSEETKRKIGQAHLGRKYRLGQKNTAESKEKSRISNTGLKRTEETCENIGKSQKKLWSDPEYHQKMIEKRKEQGKIAREMGTTSNALKLKWQNPEFRAKMLEVRRKQGQEKRLKNQNKEVKS